MKRLFSVVLIFSLLFTFAGCKGERVINPQLGGISFKAVMNLGKNKYVCDTEIDKDYNMIITVVSPEKFKDMIISVSGEKVNIDYMGISYSPDLSKIPVASAVRVLYDTVNDAKEKPLVGENGKNPVIEGKCGGYGYEFTFSPSGIPLTLKVKDLGATVEFQYVNIKGSA